jgi:acetyltransferase-like isoleucine patch superfamily enzyme
LKEKIETHLDPDVLQSRLFDSQKSAFRRYQELAIGNVSLYLFIKYELLTSLFGSFPGSVGFYLRKCFYRPLFKKMGKNVVFGRNINIRQPNKMELGENVAIADNCDLYPRGNNGRISIGNNVIIGRNTIISTTDGFIEIGDNTLVSMNCVLGCWKTSLKLGANVIVAGNAWFASGGTHGFDRVDIPISAQEAPGEGIVVEDDVWLGVRVTVLDGCTIGRGSVIGAGAVVTKDIPEFSIAYGVPAKVVRKRK